MEQLLKNLNTQQAEAVKTKDGPVLILAGPGSGKTKTLTHRIAYLIATGVKPQNILAVTFTNKAAGEMKERVNALLTANSSRLAEKNSRRSGLGGQPVIGTFHSICVRILRESAPLIGYSSSFVIYDDSDQISLIKKIMKDMEIDIKQVSPKKIRSAISNAKDDLLTPEALEARAGNYFERMAAEIYFEYQKRLRDADGLDFDDLIMQAVLLLKNNAGALKKFQNRYRYILVDEYQDTNEAQNIWLNLLAQKHNNLCVVGDDAQAIYSWRNAKVENILNFQKNRPDTKIIKLEQNYRSTKNIVEAARNIIKNNSVGYEKNLWTQKHQGEPVTLKEVLSDREEAEFILGKIEQLVQEKNYKLNDFVVLYRTNAQSRAIEEVFIRSNMPYKIVGGVKFYQRKEVKDLIAWLRLLYNPKDVASAERLEGLKLSHLKKHLVKQQAAAGKSVRTKKDAIALWADVFKNISARKGVNLKDMLAYIIKETDFEAYLRDGTEKGEERWQNVSELLSVANDYSNATNLNEALGTFLEDVTLLQEADKVDYQSDLVHLMTLHMAKGLEFPVVFVAGVEEGLLPHSSSMMSQAELEEERRLCYVGITRAKEKVFMSFARRRMMWGDIKSNPPSSFLHEIPEEYIQYEPLEAETEYLDDGFIEI